MTHSRLNQLDPQRNAAYIQQLYDSGALGGTRGPISAKAIKHLADTNCVQHYLHVNVTNLLPELEAITTPNSDHDRKQLLNWVIRSNVGGIGQIPLSLIDTTNPELVSLFIKHSIKETSEEQLARATKQYPDAKEMTHFMTGELLARPETPGSHPSIIIERTS